MRKSYTYIFCLILSISTTPLKAQICWSPLGSGINGYVYAMTNYDGNLIAAGQFDNIGGIPANNIAAWNGSSWSILGTGLSIDTAHSSYFNVSSMTEYNGELYVAGQFDTAGGVPVNNIAKWNGSSWSAVGSGISGTNFTVQAMAIYNGALYAGGEFDTTGGNLANGIAKWDGTQWTDVDGGIGNQGVVYCLTSFGGKLYAAGSFNKAGSMTTNNIAEWNDTIWSALGSGLSDYGAEVTSINFYQGNLYAAFFNFDNSYQPDSLAMWNGTVWSSLCNVARIDNNWGIDAIFPFDGNLIIGGGFDTIGGVAVNNLAQWDGTTFSEFGGGISSPNNYIGVGTFDTYNSYLYAAGFFTQVGSDSISAHSIAEYTCATDGIHEVSADHVHVYPNPSTGMVNISIDNAVAGSSVQIYDLLGQKVCQSNINSDNTSINLSGHAPGSYLYHISGGSGESISAGTLIIQ